MKPLLALSLLWLTAIAWGAPKADLDPYWQVQGEASQPSVQGWQQFLDRFLVAQGQHYLVAYQQVGQAEQAQLVDWLDQQAQINPLTLNAQAQFAYWVNLYNALTVQVVLQHYPLDSIRSLGWFNSGPWQRTVIRINQRDLSLNDIEHRILRPIFNDHRIHFVVNCAALGCPNLLPQALTEANIAEQLAVAEQAFVNSDKGVRQLSGDRWHVSSIFDWYLTDFAGNQDELIAYLNSIRTNPIPANARIRFAYDWQLNEAAQ